MVFESAAQPFWFGRLSIAEPSSRALSAKKFRAICFWVGVFFSCKMHLFSTIKGANARRQSVCPETNFPETFSRNLAGLAWSSFSGLSADKFAKCQKGPKGGENIFGAVTFVTILGPPRVAFSSMAHF